MRNGRLPCAVFGEKSFVTVVIPGNWHRTATPHGVFQALVSVVAVVIPGTWASTAMPPTGIQREIIFAAPCVTQNKANHLFVFQCALGTRSSLELLCWHG